VELKSNYAVINLLMLVLLSSCGTKTYTEAFRAAHPKAEILQEIKSQEKMVILLVWDPQIAQLQITDNQNNQWKAKIINGSNGVNYWIATLPSPKSEYKLEAVDSRGHIIKEDTYYYK
jgi:hypothetical protein